MEKKTKLNQHCRYGIEVKYIEFYRVELRPIANQAETPIFSEYIETEANSIEQAIIIWRQLDPEHQESDLWKIHCEVVNFLKLNQLKQLVRGINNV